MWKYSLAIKVKSVNSLETKTKINYTSILKIWRAGVESSSITIDIDRNQRTKEVCMAKVMVHVRRHAKKFKRATKHVHKQLKAPVHPVISWWAISVAALSAFLIINGGGVYLAHGQTAPIAPQVLSNSGSGSPQQPLPPPSGSFMPGQSFMQPPPGGQTGPNQQFMQPPSNGGFGSIQQTPPCGSSNNSGQNSPCPLFGNFGSNQTGSNQNQAPCGNSSTSPCGQPSAIMGGPGGGPGSFSPDNNQPSGDNSNSQDQKQQQMDQQRLKAMQKGAVNFAKQLSLIKAQIAKLQKQGASIPIELSQALATIDSDLSQIQNANSAQDVQSIMSGDFQNAMQTVQQWMPKLSMLNQLPAMYKQAQGQLNLFNKLYASYQKKAANSPIDLTQALAQFKSDIDQLQAALDQAKTDGASDPQTAMQDLQDNIYGQMQQAQNDKQVLDIAINGKSGLAMANKQVNSVLAQIKKLKSQGQDTSSLEADVSQAQQQLATVKSDLSATSLDTDTTMNDLEGLKSDMQTVSDELQQLTGNDGFMPQLPSSNNFQLQIPQALTGTGSVPTTAEWLILQFASKKHPEGCFFQLVDLFIKVKTEKLFQYKNPDRENDKGFYFFLTALLFLGGFLFYRFFCFGHSCHPLS